TLASLERPAEARAAYEAAQAVYRGQNEATAVARCDQLLAGVRFDLGDHAAALAHYQDALRAWTGLGLRARAARGRRRPGEQLQYLHRFAEALAAYEEAEVEFAAAGQPLDAAACARDRAGTLRLMERYTDALAVCDDAAEACARHGTAVDVAYCRQERAVILT